MAKKFKRKSEKRYTKVKFELDFIEGVFELPKFDQVPMGIQRKTLKNDPEPLFKFFKEQGSEEIVEIVDDFDSDEYQSFMEAWSAASDISLGK